MSETKNDPSRSGSSGPGSSGGMSSWGLFVGGGLVALSALFGGTIYGQDSSPAGDTEPETQQELETKFYEAMQQKRWTDAIKEYGKLTADFVDYAESDRLRLMCAQAHFELNQLKDAKSHVDQILADGSHIQARYLEARIYAKEKDLPKAKGSLITAAVNGMNIITELQTDPGKKDFAAFATDPAFIIEILRINQRPEMKVTGIESRDNPFDSPLQPQTGEGLDTTDINPNDIDPQVDARRAALEERIEGLFREILQMAEARRVEELITKFGELRQVMAEYGQEGTEEVRKKLEKYNQRLQELGEVRLSIKLQLYINEGNHHLRAMADGISAEDYDSALDHFTEIEEIVEQMRNEERPVFHRNADALEIRATSLATRARRLKRISEFELSITGIVVAEDEYNSAIIDNRIYREGDTIVEPTTDEPIDGLRINKIQRSTVEFRFEDTIFVRELRPQ